jgi:hypothetical protein
LPPVGFEWNAVCGELRADLIELCPADANGLSRVSWIGGVLDTKDIRNTAQGQKPRA